MSLVSGCSTAVERTSHNRKVVGTIPTGHCFFLLLLSSVMCSETGPSSFSYLKSRWISSLGTEGRSFLVQETFVHYCESHDYLKHNCSIK